METEIRRARRGDSRYAVGLMKDKGYHVVEEDIRRYTDIFVHVVAHAEYTVYVASKGVEVIGFVVLNIRPHVQLGGLLATLDELIVLRSHLGQGIRERLLKAAIDRAKETHCLWLETLTDRENQDVFERCGFEMIDTPIMRLNPSIK